MDSVRKPVTMHDSLSIIEHGMNFSYFRRLILCCTVSIRFTRLMLLLMFGRWKGIGHIWCRSSHSFSRKSLRKSLRKAPWTSPKAELCQVPLIRQKKIKVKPNPTSWGMLVASSDRSLRSIARPTLIAIYHLHPTPNTLHQSIKRCLFQTDFASMSRISLTFLY